jgi:hypothetical protein
MTPEELDNITSRPLELSVNSVLNNAFDAFKAFPGGFIGIFIIQIIISFTIESILGSGNPYYGDALGRLRNSYDMADVVNGIIGAMLTPGYFYVCKKIKDKESPEFSDFFYGFTHKQLQFILLHFAYLVIIILGFVLLVIPGIYLTVALSLSSCVLTFYDGNFLDALSASRKVVTKVWWKIFVLFIALFFINILGALMLLLGLLITIPLSYCAVYFAFDALFQPANTSFDDKLNSFGQEQKDINTEREERNLGQ